MNKLIMIPLTFIIILAIFSFTAGFEVSEMVYTEGEDGTYTANISGVNQTVVLPEKQVKFDAWLATGIMALLAGALVIGGAAGIRALGSGLSDTTQQMIFQAAIYLGLWASFSIMASIYLMDSDLNNMGLMLWIFLTVLYVIGFSQEIAGTAASGGS